MDNETAEIAVYEGALWMGVQIALAWATYAQWTIIYLMDFMRVALKRLKSRNLRGASISSDAKNLCKIPKHLAVILQNEAGLEDLANVVLWSFLLGVPFVTVHGQNGFPELVFQEFIRICEKKKSELKEELLPIHYHNHARLNQDNLTGCHLMMSSARESRQKLVEVTQSLCKDVQQGKLRPDEIDLKRMNEAFQDHIVEPDLAISFSSYPCLHGLDPWNTRLTEIITVPSSNGISYSTYFNVLKQFAGTKQRLGK